MFFKGINELAEKFSPITYALIHVGSAEFRYLTGPGKFTMDAKGFIKTVACINPKIAIPIYNSGWTHFKEDDTGIKRELSNSTQGIKQKIYL